MKNKSIVLVSLAILFAVFIALVISYENKSNQNIEKLSYTSAPFIREHSTVFGDNKKNVYVVEFIDPECESCALYHKVVKELYRNYYEDIQIVVRYLDNHKNSKYAIKILEASKKQNMYQAVLDKIYESQGVWAQHNNEKPELLWEELKDVPSLNLKKLRADFEKINVDNILKLDREDATKLKVRGTPTLFVNGEKLKRLSYKDLFDLVESKLYK
ncbi:DsbA family protein [Malaciobacter sp. WC5094]|uniref:DsbA family protein n=1 Tax=Arcobacter sp. YIC-80 TaxID=3376683 RepID=UPI00384E594C